MEVLTVPTIVAPRAKGLMKPYLHPILCDPALKAYYTFEKAGATLRDLSGNNNHGTITGADWVSGRYGSALNFVSASADVVNCGLAPALDFTTELFSIALWVKFESGSFQGLIQKSVAGKGFRLYKGGGGDAGTFTMETNNGATTKTTDSTMHTMIGVWNHGVFVRDSATTGKMYVNGVDDTVTGDTVNMLSPAGNNLIISPSVVANFDGLMDSVLIFNRALSPIEVKNLYEAGL